MTINIKALFKCDYINIYSFSFYLIELYINLAT